MLTLPQRIEICDTIESLRHELEGLVVRGLRSAGASEIKTLTGLHSELARVGANHLAGQVRSLLDAIQNDDRASSTHLMRVQTSLNVFERVLTLDTIGSDLALARAGEDGQPAAAPPSYPEPAPAAAPPIEDRAKLVPLLEELARATEELCGAGLTNASDATRQKLDASFKEAGRLKMLRLAATLRFVNEELDRYLKDSADFSAKRLSLFLNRAWLLSRGLTEALRKKDDASLAALLLAAAHPPVPVKALEFAVLGVFKRQTLTACSFDFRLRTLKEVPGVPAGQSLVWSCLFAHNGKVPAEAYLQLPQPQKFAPKILLDGKRLTVTDAAVALDDHGGGRLMLGPKSTVVAGTPFEDWAPFQAWDAERAHGRVAHYHVTPLALPNELTEEVVLTDWKLEGEVARTRGDQKVFELRTAEGLTLDAVASTKADGATLVAALNALKKAKTRPPLYGVMHYELCRMVFQPLSVFEGKAMRHLTISNEKIDISALVGTLDFSR